MTDQQIKKAIAALTATKRLMTSGIADNITGQPATFEALTGNLEASCRDIVYKALKAGILKEFGADKTNKGRWVPAYTSTHLYVQCESFLTRYNYLPKLPEVKILLALGHTPLRHCSGSEIIKESGIAKHTFWTYSAAMKKAGLVDRAQTPSGFVWSIAHSGSGLIERLKNDFENIGQ